MYEIEKMNYGSRIHAKMQPGRMEWYVVLRHKLQNSRWCSFQQVVARDVILFGSALDPNLPPTVPAPSLNLMCKQTTFLLLNLSWNSNCVLVTVRPWERSTGMLHKQWQVLPPTCHISELGSGNLEHPK